MRLLNSFLVVPRRLNLRWLELPLKLESGLQKNLFKEQKSISFPKMQVIFQLRNDESEAEICKHVRFALYDQRNRRDVVGAEQSLPERSRVLPRRRAESSRALPCRPMH